MAWRTRQAVRRDSYSCRRTRTTLLLRMRFHIVTKDREGITRPLLAEDVALPAIAVIQKTRTG